MTKIPVAFAFDDNYAFPASIAIQSLIDAKLEDTEYDIIVFHSGLKETTIEKMDTICPIRYIKVDKSILANVPQGWSGLETYYRLLISSLLPEYDKVIWSDVDVLFKGDLSNIYNTDMEDADWAGVIAERQDETKGVHPHYKENKKPYIYMPGFMIVNSVQWREKNMWQRFLKIIDKYGEKLKYFDLDILNLAAEKIMSVPFEYCVLENIYDESNIENAPEYPWLERSQGKEALLKAKNNPIIIHYAGKNPKIWMRKMGDIPSYYWEYMKKSPFFDKEKYFPGFKRKAISFLLWCVMKLCLVKKTRQKLKNKRKSLICK